MRRAPNHSAEPAWIPTKAGRHRDIEIATMSVPRSSGAFDRPPSLVPGRATVLLQGHRLRQVVHRLREVREERRRQAELRELLLPLFRLFDEEAGRGEHHRGRPPPWQTERMRGDVRRLSPGDPRMRRLCMKSIAARRVPSFTLRASALACPCRTSCSSMIFTCSASCPNFLPARRLLREHVATCDPEVPHPNEHFVLQSLFSLIFGALLGHVAWSREAGGRSRDGNYYETINSGRVVCVREGGVG